MYNILTELWNGNLSPVVDSGKHDPEIEDLRRLMVHNGEKLSATLNEAEKNTFQNYISCVEEYLTLSEEHAFCDGFRLACKFLTEALS